MWLAYVLLCRDIELACDEKATKDMDKNQRADYCEALLKCSVNSKTIDVSTLVSKLSKDNEYYNEKYDYSKVNYTYGYKKVCIICPEHGEFWQKANDHISGKKGCPKCRLKSQTKLYEKLKESFINEKIMFEVGNSTIGWINGQRFDIYFPKYNIAIEYNGIQHYVPVEHFGGELKFQDQLEYDKLKRQKCKENNCTLFEVKYDYTKRDYQKLVENIQNIINNYGS